MKRTGAQLKARNGYKSNTSIQSVNFEADFTTFGSIKPRIIYRWSSGSGSFYFLAQNHIPNHEPFVSIISLWSMSSAPLRFVSFVAKKKRPLAAVGPQVAQKKACRELEGVLIQLCQISFVIQFETMV
jgi:hypothetical protein